MLDHLPSVSVQLEHWDMCVPDDRTNERYAVSMIGNPLTFRPRLEVAKALQQSLYNCERLRAVHPDRVGITDGVERPMLVDEVEQARARYAVAATEGAASPAQSSCCIA